MLKWTPAASIGTVGATAGDSSGLLGSARPSVGEGGSQTTQEGGPKSPLGPGGEKACCYECFKQFYQDYAVTREDSRTGGTKRFCSDACAGGFDTKIQAHEERRRQLLEKQEAFKHATEACEVGAASQTKAATGGDEGQ